MTWLIVTNCSRPPSEFGTLSIGQVKLMVEAHRRANDPEYARKVKKQTHDGSILAGVMARRGVRAPWR